MEPKYSLESTLGGKSGELNINPNKITYIFNTPYPSHISNLILQSIFFNISAFFGSSDEFTIANDLQYLK